MGQPDSPLLLRSSPPPPPPPAPTQKLNPTPVPLPNPNSAALISTSKSKQINHKNQLQEYAQRLSLPLPAYCTVNEGPSHDPQFRSTVSVDGTNFISQSTFSTKKAAEQDVARIAIKFVLQKIKEDGCLLVQKNMLFCKSMLNEYAAKMTLSNPTYNTVQAQGLVPAFVSSLVFNNKTYVGNTANTKKEAERLAAQAVVLHLMGNPDSSKLMSEIVKCKFQVYAGLNKVEETNVVQCITTPTGVDDTPSLVNAPFKNEASITSENMPPTVAQTTSGLALPLRIFKRQKLEEPSDSISLPITFFRPSLEQQGVGSSASRKRRKKKRKANKPLESTAMLINAPTNLSPVACQMVHQEANLPAIKLV